MNSFALFTDVSLNPELRCGVGAYLVIPASMLQASPDSIDKTVVDKHVVVRRFENTTSTRLECQTVVWALEEYQNTYGPSEADRLQVYTDSQGIAGLLRRRQALELKGFRAKRSNLQVKNAALYRAFYEFSDMLGFEIIKVPGHSRYHSHDAVGRIFSFVDRKARKALNLWMDEIKFRS